MKLLKILIGTLLIILIINFKLRADTPSFEIITLKYDKKIYYFQIENIYDSISKDFKYYDHNHVFVNNVIDRIKNCLSGKETRENYHLYKSLDILNIKKFQKELGFDNKLYIFKDEVIHIPKGMIDNFIIINAYIGNVSGYRYSENLKAEDNEWIRDTKMIKLFKFPLELCTMYLFGAKDSLTKWELEDYIQKIKKSINPGSCNILQDILTSLYKKKVIMIGFCGC